MVTDSDHASAGTRGVTPSWILPVLLCWQNGQDGASHMMLTCSASALTAAKLCGGCSGVVGASLGGSLRSKASLKLFTDLSAYNRVGECLKRGTCWAALAAMQLPGSG